MNKLNIEIDSILSFVSEEEIQQLQGDIMLQHTLLTNRQGKGNSFLGWLDLPSGTPDDALLKIEMAAQKLAACSEVVVVIGIGGSYLGAKSLIEALQDPFAHLKQNKPTIVYAGHQLSQDYLVALLDLLDKKDYSLVVISKSGTTTEPAIAFRMLKKHLENKYGKTDAAQRIVAITDEEKGALKQMADEDGYPTFVIPDNVGGR